MQKYKLQRKKYKYDTERLQIIDEKEIKFIMNYFDIFYDYFTTPQIHVKIGTKQRDLFWKKSLVQRFHHKKQETYNPQKLFSLGICSKCSVNYKFNNLENLYICPICGDSFYCDSSEQNDYEPSSSFAHNLGKVSQEFGTSPTYSKVENVKNYLIKIQGKEKATIPQEIIAFIKHQMVRDGIKKTSQEFNYFRINKYLSKQTKKIAGYKKHIFLIYKLISGKQIVALTKRDEERLIKFCEPILIAISHYIRSSGCMKNNPGSWYIIMKLADHLNIYIPFKKFHEIKNTEKIKALDEMWKYVCNNTNIGLIYKSTIN